MQPFSSDLLDRPMSRAEFLKHMGVGLVLLFGGGIILQYLHGVPRAGVRTKSTAYGANTYGGTRLAQSGSIQ